MSERDGYESYEDLVDQIGDLADELRLRDVEAGRLRAENDRLHAALVEAAELLSPLREYEAVRAKDAIHATLRAVTRGT